MDQDKKQNTQNPQDTSDFNRQGQQQQPDQQRKDNKEQDQRRQPGSNPEHEGQKDRKTA